ncbi:P2Y purinoceptor 4-like isoform X2 [Brienomyrus brachyistius]|uniref:P2Y purinoceptor 4-like isoform X2 n=1 Tax=Brienomyrus brachyistius TaxID=42636 RepID=UPI0020B3F4A5|nr:P2Y purinoceptor 4-like isoform X2 [Brienomyrus brachyistius]
MMTAIPGQRRGNLTSFSPCSIDESYKYIFLPICYSFTFVFSLSLNSVVLYHSFRRTRHWNASLIYMVNLASTDLMYGLSLPFLVASYVMRDHWVFGDFMCRLVRFLFYFNLYCSIFFLTCISVHRYLGICHPMRIITMETKRAVKGTCILVWAVVFALTSPIFRFAQTGDLTRAAQNGHLAESKLRPGPVEVVLNCWDDATDTEILLYIPYVTSGVECHTMRMVSICYKITRPLASFNAWLNALLYFLTKEKGAQCCPSPDPALHGLLWPLRAFGRGGEEEEGGGEVVDNKENESKSSGNRFRGLA